MAYKYSKGWYLKQLKEMGITKHPVELKKLELYRTFVIRKLYFEHVEKTNQ
jgi:hypothetical protein